MRSYRSKQQMATHFNPFAAVYIPGIRFQAVFRLAKIPLIFITYFVVDAQLIK